MRAAIAIGWGVKLEVERIAVGCGRSGAGSLPSRNREIGAGGVGSASRVDMVAAVSLVRSTLTGPCPFLDLVHREILTVT
jgi:hypothetical protein